MISRRGFLTSLLPAALIAPVLVEKLIWQPTKTFFLPPALGWYPRGNTLLTLSEITNEALKILNNDLVFVHAFNEQQAIKDLNFMLGTEWPASVINVRRPPRYLNTFGV